VCPGACDLRRGKSCMRKVRSSIRTSNEARNLQDRAALVTRRHRFGFLMKLLLDLLLAPQCYPAAPCFVGATTLLAISSTHHHGKAEQPKPSQNQAQVSSFLFHRLCASTTSTKSGSLIRHASNSESGSHSLSIVSHLEVPWLHGMFISPLAKRRRIPLADIAVSNVCQLCAPMR